MSSMRARIVLHFTSFLNPALVTGVRKRQGLCSWPDQERGGGRHVSLPPSQARPEAKPHYKSETAPFLPRQMLVHVRDEEFTD
jgi:hypothetical protein